jgi:CRISPR-associated protein Cas1
MKKLLNTLFITTQGSYLHKEGETIIISVEKETRLQLPLHTLGGIVCFGNVSMSPFLMGACAEHNIAVSFHSEHGKFLASIRGKISGNVLLRREQYRRADDPAWCARISREILTGKILNCRSVLNRAVRDHAEKINSEAVEASARHLSLALVNLEKASDLDSLRGIEGDASRVYFHVFDHLILAQKNDFVFLDRNRRPPLDNVNCLLSFIYSLIAHDVRSACECVGLDPFVGFLHRDRPGRPGLALDLMEEFRPFIGDRLVLSLINREQVDGRGFIKSEAGGIVMNEETRKTVLVAYQKRKQEELYHPYINETVQIGLLFYVQALLLARHLREDLDGYPVFIWK